MSDDELPSPPPAASIRRHLEVEAFHQTVGFAPPGVDVERVGYGVMPLHVQDEDDAEQEPDEVGLGETMTDEELSDVVIRKGEILPAYLQRRAYDVHDAQLWLWYTFKAHGGRIGSRYNKVGYAKMARLFCEHYGIPEPDEHKMKTFRQTIKKYIIRGRKLALESASRPYEELVAERRSELEDVMAAGYEMMNHARYSDLDESGKPKTDFKLLDKGARLVYLGSDRAAILDGVDAPIKQAIRMEHSGKVAHEHELKESEGQKRMRELMERAQQNAQIERERLQSLTTGEAVEIARADVAALRRGEPEVIDAELVEEEQ